MSIRRTTTIARTGILSVVSKHQSDDISGVHVSPLLADLFTAYFCARQNKRNTVSQVRFERDLCDNLMALYDEIASGRYRVGRSMCFIIRDPVQREVFAASFRDRIVHHLLYNWLMPVFEPTFIYDSYSCREGKGTLFGIKRLEHHMRSCSNNFRKPCFVLKLDIEGYFMNISRQKLYDMIFSRLLKYASCSSCIPFDVSVALQLLSQVIFNDPTKGCYRKGSLNDWVGLPSSKSLFHAPAGCGLPIGNLTSQLFSNVYLSSLDNYVKRVLKIRHYGRYVDDFYLVANTREELLSAIPDIRAFLLDTLGLRLHPKKVHLVDAEKGVMFLGAFVKPYQRLMGRRGQIRARLRMACVLTEEKDPFRVQVVMNSYNGYASHFHQKRHPFCG